MDRLAGGRPPARREGENHCGGVCSATTGQYRRSLHNIWNDLQGEDEPKPTWFRRHRKSVQRCILMTTDPGDLVLDPTCGSGTTAYVAEQWGRRWITIDTSRVPLALARQRLLTATFPYYQLADEKRGPAGGFVYKRKQNSRGEEVGGIVPHVTLKSIANNEPPAEEVLVDRPEIEREHHAGLGAFTVEGTIPPPVETPGEARGVRRGRHRLRRQVRRPDARSAPQEPGAPAGGKPHRSPSRTSGPRPSRFPSRPRRSRRARRTSRSRSPSAPRTGR